MGASLEGKGLREGRRLRKRLTAKEALKLLEETREAIASLDEQDRGIQAALTIGWEESTTQPQKLRDANPREWSPRPGGGVQVSDVREILESMGMELEQSDPDRQRDAVSVALLVMYNAIYTIKKNLLDNPNAKMLRRLAIEIFEDEQGRKPKLPPRS